MNTIELNPKTPQPGRGAFGTQALHVFVLLSLAFAARLYDLLGRQPSFFAVRQSHGSDVLLSMLLLSVVLPGLVVACLWLIGRPAPRLRQASYSLLVLLCMTAIALPPLKRLGLPGWSVLALGAVLGLAATAVYFRFVVARRFVTILSPVVVLFPAMFLVGSPTARLLWWTVEPPLSEVKVGNPVPVVFIVFDEFSGISLMDAQRRIDLVRYPNFAAMAREAIWFRNATTMSTSTHHAVPSLLTGEHPHGPSAAPVLSEYPRNLFTLLGRSHRLVVEEAETYLCPAGWSGEPLEEASLPRRLWSLTLDAAVLESYIVLPSDWPLRLPDVTGRWGNFLDQDRRFGGRPSPHASRYEQFEHFLDRIRPSDEPGLYYAHLMLPHVPWNYQPSGKEYGNPLEALAADSVNITHGLIGLHRHTEHWTRDEEAVDQAYHRYLLQVGFVDRLVGRLVDHLKRAGLYDQSLIVLTADHGVSCRPDRDRRTPDDVNAPDILSIPLLVKLPHQREGRTSDRNVQSADLLPTIAEVLKIELPWATYGASVLDSSRPEPAEKEISLEDPWEERLKFDGPFEAKYDALAAMLAMARGSAGQGGQARGGLATDLIGRRLDELELSSPVSCRIELARPEEFADVKIDGPRVPCYIGGRVEPGPDVKLPLELAVSVGGTIRAVTRTFQIEGLETCWAALVPEASFRPGRNEIRVLVISSSVGKRSVHPTQ